MNNAAHIIVKFGGLTNLAVALGHKHPSTVQGWQLRETIPQRHWELIISAAKSKGISLTLTDFVPKNVCSLTDDAPEHTVMPHI